jgi:hypothetical protein
LTDASVITLSGLPVACPPLDADVPAEPVVAPVAPVPDDPEVVVAVVEWLLDPQAAAIRATAMTPTARRIRPE